MSFKKYFRKHRHKTPPLQRVNTNNSEADKSYDALIEEMSALRESVEKNTRVFKLPYRFAMGLFTGLGTVFGATILVSVVIYLLKPFASIDMFKPFVNQVIEIVERRKPKEPKPLPPPNQPRVIE